MNMNFHQTTELYTGRGCVAAKGALMARLGKKCLILTGATAAKACGALADVTAVLDGCGIEYRVYDRVGQNPAMENCVEAGELAREYGAEFIIGIGGGSPIDAAKAAAAVAANPGLDHGELVKSRFPVHPLPIVAVGTTAGTGTEVTGVAVITDYDGEKKSLRGPMLYPALAYGDPGYTMSLPDYFTRSTAVDALAHCTESYFSQAANEISSAFAVRGVQLLMEGFAAIAEKGTEELSYEEREKLYYGSIYGGYALTVTSTVFPHGIGLILSEKRGLPHGLACGVFQPKFFARNKEKAPERYAEFFRAVGVSPERYMELFEAVMPKLDITLTREDILPQEPRWAASGSVKRTLGGMSPEEVTEILCEMFVK